MSDSGINIKEVGAIKVASLWYQGLPFQETVPRAFGELAEWMTKNGLPKPAGSPWGLALYYDDPKAVAPQQVRFKVAIPVPSDTQIGSEGSALVEIIPSYRAAYISVVGSYENLEEVYSRLARWVLENGHQFSDVPREVMVKWGETMPPEEWVTEVHFPIEPQ